MEQIIELLNKAVNIYEANQMPNWLTISCTIVLPLAFSAIVIIQNHVISRRNERLQKDIYNNEIKVKVYDIISNVYVTFINAYQILPTKHSLDAILTNGRTYSSILITLIEGRDKLVLESKKIQMLLKNDKNIVEKMKSIEQKYVDIVDEISQASLTNKQINVEYVLKNIEDYKELLRYENYDKYFEEYLSLKEMK